MLDYNEKDYWNARYKQGRTSGAGSYGEEAEAKIACINKLIRKHRVKTVLDLGCGDGNITLMLAQENPGVQFYAEDISEVIIDQVQARAESLGITNIAFGVGDAAEPTAYLPVADLVLCLDVLFHIKDDVAFNQMLANIARVRTKASVISMWTDKLRGVTLCDKPVKYQYYRDYEPEIPPGFEGSVVALPVDTKALYVCEVE